MIYYQIYDGADWPMPKEHMAEILQTGGTDVSVGRFALRLDMASLMSFEEYGGGLGDPCIEADCRDLGILIEDVKKVSAALTKADIAHCLDVYSDEDDDIFSIGHKDRPLRAKDGNK